MQDELIDAGAADRTHKGGGGDINAVTAEVRGGDGRLQGLQELHTGDQGEGVCHSAALDHPPNKFSPP